MPTAAISLGASFGDRRRSLTTAWGCIRGLATGGVVGVSRIYETSAVGGVARRPFLNAVVCVRTELEPEPLRAALAGLEHRLGRRVARRWADRLLDLDVLLYDDHVVRSPALVLPHPRLAERPFLLAMLYEAWPSAPNPWTGRPWRAGLPAPLPTAVVGALARTDHDRTTPGRLPDGSQRCKRRPLRGPP